MSQLSLSDDQPICPAMIMPPDQASIEDALDELVADFDVFDDWEDRIAYVIDLGKALPPLPDVDRVEVNKVPGCAAQVWLAHDVLEGRLFFRADSDSAISRGNVALLLKLFSGRTSDDILGFDAKAALDRLGLPQALTRQRANGLNSMVGRIRQSAQRV